MKKIKIFRDFVPSNKCDFDYKDFKIVNDNSYDYAILFNTPFPKLTIPKENVIGFLWEPKCSKNLLTYEAYAKEKIGAYITPDARKLGKPFVEHHTFMSNFQNYSPLVSKKFPICMVVSDCRHLFGHKKRHTLVSKILKTNMDIHFYGRGLDKLYKDHRIKGSFKHFSEVYPFYNFDITIENVREHSLISEKLGRPIVHETCPLYWGSPNISNYFSDCFYNLPDDDDVCIAIISEIYNNPQKFYSEKKEALAISKKSLLNYNYLDFANHFFEKGQIDNITL